MSKKLLDRRTLLRGACGAAIALPWLEVMGCANGDGSRIDVDAVGSTRQSLDGAPGVTSDGFPKRFIALNIPNGTIPDAWFPSGGETDFKLGAIHAALEKYRSSLTIFKGIDNAAGHVSSFDSPHFGGLGAMLTGHPSIGATEGSMLANGISIDQYLGQKIAAGASAPPFRSIVAGTHYSGSGTSNLSYAGPRMPLNKTWRASDLFDSLFKGAAAPDAMSDVRARRKSILDGALKDGNALLSKLGTQDRARLQSHLDALREVEQRLGKTTACNSAAFKPGTTEDSTVMLPAMHAEMFDVLTLAFSCDLTRAASYVMRLEGSTGGISTYNWLGIGPAGVDSRTEDFNSPDHSLDHHVLSHNDSQPDARAQLIKISTWYVEQVALFADRLKALPEGAGTVFDHSVVLFGSAIGQGNHTLEDIPYFLLGNAGGALRSGRYLQYQHASNNDLLVSILNAMGVPDTTFGDSRYCTGPLPGLI